MASNITQPPPDNHPDIRANTRGYIKATDYATAYSSNHFTNVIPDDKLPLLRHVNCGYLSHPRCRPPTLLALKQHAQALTILIRSLCIASQAGEIDNKSKPEAGRRQFHESEAFDWLNDLETRYENTDQTHNTPLLSLANVVERQTDLNGTKLRCPLTKLEDDPTGGNQEVSAGPVGVRPFASHHNLLMHANECLEMLDHEFSATGGFMSVLPTDGRVDTADMLSARNSLVGQWLIYTQALVGRMHELEISYGRALDVMATEAEVPRQMRGRAGAAAQTGREIAFPQDRWVLANAGDDVFDYLHGLLDMEEAQYEEREKIWRTAGVSGERMWMKHRGGEEIARGMVTLDVVTRYYRLKGQGKSTIFLIPAWEVHPKCQRTAEIEARPTVVVAPAPLWPTRVSDWEARNRKKLDEAETRDQENLELVRAVGRVEKQLSTQTEQMARLNNLVEFYEGRFTKDREQAEVVRAALEELDLQQQKLAELREVLPEEYHEYLDS